MKAYDKLEVDEIFGGWQGDLSQLSVMDVIPLSVIEDIKAEIAQFKDNEHTYEYGGFDRAYNGIMDIIDNHISGKESNE